ncbi:MAG: alanyl-tRNA editing protein [Candidatus Heimdallarchaeota archaeon]|nr:alanyl-tRNA editing protein [Candidatus Heimdallarchaeota archaeon]MCK4955167.1 alanyl-tRNA editing protein [Candidatus Heimdallarchaeota archaeon]
MTELLFLKDSYIKDFEAIIINIEEDCIILDKTAFSYRGGGLQSDEGVLETSSGQKYSMIEAFSKSGKILHKISPEPDSSLAGQKVNCKINWVKRYRQMRMHTALHAISGLLHKKYGSTVTGGNITPEKSRVDFEIDHLRQERVQEIIEEMKIIVKGDHKISTSFMERDEALKDPELIRTKVNLIPPSVKKIRVVDIEDVDRQADGGVHVSSTKEIGTIIPIKSENRGKNNKRLYFTVE